MTLSDYFHEQNVNREKRVQLNQILPIRFKYRQFFHSSPIHLNVKKKGIDAITKNFCNLSKHHAFNYAHSFY